MKDKEEVINTIKMYLGLRGVGHTYTMVNGVKTVDAIVLVAHKQDEKYINSMAGRKVDCVSLDAVHRLRGNRKPLVVDNHALSILLGWVFDIVLEYQKETNRLRSQIRDYEKTIGELKLSKK